MQKNTRVECPKCSRPLHEFNGHIGRCSQHKWVSPTGLGYEAEAAEQNRQEAAAAEQSRLAQVRKEEEAKAQEIREQHQSAIRKAIVVLIALATIVAAIVFFIVRPSVNYKSATNKFVSGEYQAARDGYSALKNYKDSAARVVLCDAMIDLQEGRPEDAAAKLDQLISDGQGDSAKQLADALIPVMADWKAKGLTPQALLLLLGKANLIDPNGALDIAKLNEEGHTALLNGSQLSTYTADVNSDGDLELVALNPDYSIAVYRMTGENSIRMAVDNATASSCAMVFGNKHKDTDISAAVACFAEAYRLLPNEDTRSALTSAYQLRSASFENAGDMSAAIADALSAMETAGTAEAFTFFYDVNLRHCKNGHDAATAIAMWNEFATKSLTELTRFSAKNHWQADAAQLHITRAAELAAQKDEACIDELRVAAEMGADVSGAIAEAQTHFEPGLSLARLRLLEIDLMGTDEAKIQQIQANLADEVRTAISEWKTRGITPADVPALIHLADNQGIELIGINRDTNYKEAAIASAGNVSQYTFVDWNIDGYQELLTLESSGKLSLYGINKTWGIISAIDTKLPGATYAIADESAPLILVLSSGKDEMLALTGTSKKLSALFRETGISRYKADGKIITFSRLLAGSIARYNDYTYEAAGTTNRPVRTAIDWQQNDYPQPANAAEAVQRYFEARAYDISDEAAFLTEQPVSPDFFSLDRLSALAVPDVPGTVSAVAYKTQERRVLFEITYPSGTESIRAWVAAEYINGWKLTGAADAYGADLSTSGIDFSIPLISLNAETTNTISTRGGRSTYRLLIPTAGRVRLVWQSGSKASSRTSHTITMCRDSLTGDSVFAFPLPPNTNKQQSKDMFVAAGVYYVTVEANIKDAESYRMTIAFDAETHVELESNDTYKSATALEVNTGYSGMLSSAKDVDYFSFSLEETSAVNVTFGIPGGGSKFPAYILTIISATNGSKLSTVSVPGNALLTETGNLYLSSGTYLVQVAKGTTFTNDEYVLIVNVNQNGNMESEPNNTPETANTVPIDEDIHASMGQEGDIDCYSFTLDGDAVIQPRFTFTPTDSASKTYVLTIVDANRREMLKVNIGGKESTKIMMPVALAAGTYTVKIENPRFVRQDYTLRLVSMAVDAAEKEPNDSAALATELGLDQPRTGVLTTDGDVDYYKIVFTEPTTIVLKYTFPQSMKSDPAFLLTVEQNGRTLWTASVKSDSGGTEKKLQFHEGEYYIKVLPINWYGAVYSLACNRVH